ncbi:hypothetical protein M405DRAFT_407214 [Rhizopogon salebrosus TDB-379]|nr:hypothetical protein M405DRAFT_407214 [Rhizopogon salebrosus TDB-379]
MVPLPTLHITCFYAWRSISCSCPPCSCSILNVATFNVNSHFFACLNVSTTIRMHLDNPSLAVIPDFISVEHKEARQHPGYANAPLSTTTSCQARAAAAAAKQLYTILVTLSRMPPPSAVVPTILLTKR